MGKHALLTLLLFSLIVLNGSDASFVRDLRKLVALDPKDTKTPTQDPPPPNQKKPDPNPVGETKNNNKEDPKSSNNGNTIPPAPQPQPLPKVQNEKGQQKEPDNTVPPPVPKKDDDSKSQEEEKKKKENEGKAFSHSTTNETCDGLKQCRDDGDMVACIPKIDPKYLIVLLQNRGDGTIKAKLLIESNLGDIEVGKNQTEKINITLISGESTHLTLNAGKGDCVLHPDTRVPKGNFFLRLPSNDKILTPVHGAYFLILTVLVFGGTWACCKLRKKRHDEVPYQELEMALPESVSATNVESAEGWDQGWNDDWDDDVAVKSPAVHAGSISANGLTSRSSNKDGWENNWDD